MGIVGLILGWFIIGAGLAAFLAATFFGVKEKNLEENSDDL